MGDNADQFPNDPNETIDSDGDGVGDNGDVDTDNDGIINEAEGVVKKYRYIRLMKSGSNPGSNIMNLAEIEVIDNLGVNRARNASASSSSNYGTRFYAPACVDGRRAGDGLSNQGMCSTGQSSANEWWQVDLGGLYDIRQIQIFNRDDCCQDRLSNVYVLASQTPFANNTDLSVARSNADFEFQIGNVTASNPDRIINVTPDNSNNSNQLLDDFETNLGWTTNPFNTDTATTGQWQVANPAATSSSGAAMQLDNTTSGLNALVTQAAAGSSVGVFDIDNGVTSALSPSISLPGGVTTLKFNYYFAHLNNTTSEDFFRVSIRFGGNQQTILSQVGASTIRAASWTAFSVDVSAYAGQSIQLLVEAADAGAGSIIEAGIDDISMTVTILSSNDADNDGVMNENDLDSDNDTIPDVVEAGLTDADGNYLVDDLINDQGSVTNPPDSDGDGIPDFLDLESQNAANNGTAYDIDTTVNAALDTNNDGMIGSADSGGGVDADNDGIDDLVDTNPTQPGGGSGPTDSDGDGVPDTEDAYPNDAMRTVPSISVNNVTVMENSGNALLSIDLSTQPRKPATIVVSTANGSAINGSDYTAVNMTLTYALGESSKSVLIPLVDDITPEGTENFTVNLNNPSNLTLDMNSATVTIQDNDSGGLSDACFEPNFDPMTEKGVFIWELCDGSGEWRMRVTGGGDSNGVFYNGFLESVGGLTYTEFSIEGHDAIDNSNPDLLAYVMKTWNGAVDGLDFVPSTDACLTTTAPDAPMYLGQNRILVQSPFNLTTLAACDVVPPTAECGEPTYDSATEQGIFLWKNCLTDQWEVRLSAGGDAGGAIVSGKVTSTSGFNNLTEFSLEASDTVDNVTNSSEIGYELKAWNAAQDGFGFTPLSADACFIQESGLLVYLGEGKQLVTSPLNLDTLASCNIAPEPAECGEPGYDRATDPGLYLWKDCSTSGADAQWRVRVAGGGLSWGPYSGSLMSSNPVTATGVQLEASDTIDATLGDNGLDYILNVANAAEDGLDISIPANSVTCFDSQVMPVGSQLYVGRNRLQKTAAFNLEGLGVCQ